MSGKAQLGSLQFNVERLVPGTAQKQSLEGGAGYYKMRMLDFSGGLEPQPGVRPSIITDQNFETILQRPTAYYGRILENTFRWNPGGYQTRQKGLCILPDVQTNQSSITSEEDISGGEAANWLQGSFDTPLGGSAILHFMWAGHKLYSRTTAGAMQVVATFTNLITAVGKVVVNGSEAIAVAVRGTSTAADSKIWYCTDPHGSSPTFNALVALSNGDYVTGILYVATEGPGYNVVVGKVGGTNGTWWFNTTTAAVVTLETLVLQATKDQSNTGNATLSTGQVYPAFVMQSNTNIASWSNLSDLQADSSDASATGAGSGVEGLYGIWDLSSYIPPAGIEYVGVEFIYKRSESNASANVTTKNLYFATAPRIVASSLTQISRDRGSSGDGSDMTEWATTTEEETIGSSSDLWSVDTNYLRGTDLGVYMNLSGPASTFAANTRAWRLNVYYRRTGSGVSFALGGWQETPDPLRPNVLTIFTPSQDEITARTRPRHGWEIETVWDSAQERPEISAINAIQDGGLYVRHSFPYKMGHALITNADSGPGLNLQLVTGGNIYDLDFPGYDGQYITKINSVFAVKEYLVLDCIMYDTDGTTVVDRQFWYWNGTGGTFHNDFMRQSNTNGLAIAAAPLPCAGLSMNIADELYYSLFPNSTHTAIVRARLPSDPGADPRIVGASAIKSMGWTAGSESVTTYIYSQELEVGASQDVNAVMAALRQISSRRISAATGASYGSVTLEVATDGSTAFTSPPASHAFTSYGTRFQVLSGGAVGQTFMYRIGLAHDAGSADTPDGLGFVSTLVEQYTHEETWTLYCDPETLRADGVQSVVGGPLDVFSFMLAVRKQAKATPIMKLTLGNYKESSANLGVPVEFLGFGAVNWGAPDRGEPFTEQDLESPPNAKGETQKALLPLQVRLLEEPTMSAT